MRSKPEPLPLGIGRPPKHGARMLERVLRQNKLDQRTKTARMLRMLADDLAADAGGWEHLTNREKVLVERSAAQAVIIQSIEAWVFKQEGPITPTGELLGVLRRGYIGHLARLTWCLVALGLRPDRAAKMTTLAEHIARATPAASEGNGDGLEARASADCREGRRCEPGHRRHTGGHMIAKLICRECGREFLETLKYFEHTDTAHRPPRRRRTTKRRRSR